LRTHYGRGRCHFVAKVRVREFVGIVQLHFVQKDHTYDEKGKTLEAEDHELLPPSCRMRFSYVLHLGQVLIHQKEKVKPVCYYEKVKRSV
jgi:hypothetical protein